MSPDCPALSRNTTVNENLWCFGPSVCVNFYGTGRDLAFEVSLTVGSTWKFNLSTYVQVHTYISIYMAVCLPVCKGQDHVVLPSRASWASCGAFRDLKSGKHLFWLQCSWKLVQDHSKKNYLQPDHPMFKGQDHVVLPSRASWASCRAFRDLKSGKHLFWLQCSWKLVHHHHSRKNSTFSQIIL